MQTPRTWSSKLAVSSLIKQQIFIDFAVSFRRVVFCLKMNELFHWSTKLVALLATLFLLKYQRISTGCDIIDPHPQFTQ